MTIAAGQTSASINVSIINNSLAGPNVTITFTELSPTNASIGSTSLQTITIFNDLLGNFNITGITGPSDVGLDAFLNGGVNPTINWGASTGATSYNVTVYQNDGATVQCALVNTLATSYSFTTCALTAGFYYKVKVIAKGTGPSQNANNNLYSFLVNSPPIPAVISARFVMMNSSVAIDVVTGASCAYAGCTIVVASTANGSIGTTSYSGNNITYTPGVSNTGSDSFSYVISDSRGATATGTVNIKIMTPFTWTGDINNSWSGATGGNWCGGIKPDYSGCLGGVNPGASDISRFNNTCSGASCSATIASNVNVAGLVMAAGYGGTITQGAATTITIGGSHWIQASGTFVGSSQNITINGKLSQTGGVFTSTSGTLQVGIPAFTWTEFLVVAAATFTHNSGTVQFNGVQPGCVSGQVMTIDVSSSLTLNNVVVNGDWNSMCGTTIHIIPSGQRIIVLENLSHIGGVLGGTWELRGNLVIGNLAKGSTGSPNDVIIMNGTGAQTYSNLTGGYDGGSAGLEINKASGTVTAAADGTANLYIQHFKMTLGSFTAPTSVMRLAMASFSTTLFKYTAGTFTPNNGTISFAGKQPGCVGDQSFLIDIPDQFPFDSVDVTGDNNSGCGHSTMKVVTGATLLVRGNFTHTLGKIDGSWEVRGNVAFNSTANGPATLIMSGTNAQTLSRTGTEPTGTITVNKSALGVTLTTALNFNSAGQSFNITSGTLNMAGFNLTLNALVLSPTTSISRIAGTLTVSGSPVGAGPYSGGTISN